MSEPLNQTLFEQIDDMLALFSCMLAQIGRLEGALQVVQTEGEKIFDALQSSLDELGFKADA